MKKLVIVSVLVLPLFTGCTYLSKLKTQAVPPVATSSKVVVDPKLLQACEPLEELSDTAGIEDISFHHIKTIGAYGICKSKQDDSIKTIRKLANIE